MPIWDMKIQYDYGIILIFKILIIVANTQIIAAAVAFMRGPPFRENLIQNRSFLFCLIVGVTGHLIVMLYPEFIVVQTLQVYIKISHFKLCMVYPADFRFFMICYCAFMIMVMIGFEKVVVEWLIKRHS
jgi:hypothetical protein